MDSAEEVLQNWEQLKLKEKGRKHRYWKVPVSLLKAYRIQDKARGAGFDWKQKEEVWTSKRGTARVRDRNSESRPGKDGAGIRGFFSIINVARLYGINPENALKDKPEIYPPFRLCGR